MNDKWFNFAIIISIVTIFCNAFITIASMQPDQNNNNILFFGNLVNNSLSYSNLKNTSDYNIGGNNVTSGISTTQPSNEQGFPAITDTSGDPFGLTYTLQLITNMAIGLELIMLQLAGIFPILAPLFLSIAGIGFLTKGLVVSYLASSLLRLIFGRVQ